MVTLSSINFNTSSSRTSWKNLLDLIYPKGSVYYRTASATVPGVSFGGNWGNQKLFMSNNRKAQTCKIFR